MTEDLSGYGGSKDWNRFYSFIYMNDAYANAKQFDVALGKHGTAGSWKTGVVQGPGT